MAKVVDHNARRTDVLEAAWRVIAREGIDGASVRAIAREVSWSTGVLAHYFVNKDEILQGALQRASGRQLERARKRVATKQGAVALFWALTEGMPLDAERLLEAQVCLAFWGRAVANRQLREIQHTDFNAWISYAREVVEGAAQKRDLTSSVATDQLAAALIAAIDGATIEAALYPERVTPEYQIEVLLTTLKPALTPKARAAVEAEARELLADLADDAAAALQESSA